MKKALEIITVKMGYEGISMYVMRLVRNMRRENVQVDFVAIGEPPQALKDELNAMGCKLHVIPGRLRHPLRYMRRLKSVIREGGYEVVHAHGNSCTLAIEMLAAKLGGVKVRAAHSHNTYCKFTLVHKLLRPAFNALYTHAWACGTEAGRWLFGKRDFRVLRVSSETAKYAFDGNVRSEYREMLSLGDATVFGCVANFNTQKNHGFLLEVFAEYSGKNPGAKLLLVGDGALRSDIEAKIAALGLNDSVVLLGSRDDVPQILQACDGMLLTSLHEGFPSVLIEWQCAGLRALVSENVTRDTDLTGLLKFMPIDNAKAWADAMAEMDVSSDRAAVSAMAIEKVRGKGYDITDNARRLEEFYING